MFRGILPALVLVPLLLSPSQAFGARPVAPANLVATEVSGGDVEVTWDDRSNDEAGFELERSDDGGVSFANVANLLFDSELFLDQNVAPTPEVLYRVRAVGTGGQSAWAGPVPIGTSPPPPPPPPPPGGGDTRLFGTSADTFVAQGRPSTNYGLEPVLDVRGASARALLRFDVDPGTVEQALLRLTATRDGTVATEVAPTVPPAAAWDEASVTWDTQPALGAPVGSLPASATGGAVTVDVTSIVASAAGGDGGFSLVLSAGGPGQAQFASRDAAAGAPELEVVYAGPGGGGTSDVDVTHIGRLPRIDYSASPNVPQDGDSVTWVAHVRNRGDSALQDVSYAWSIDGVEVATGEIASIPLFGKTTVELPWVWDSAAHDIDFVADPAGAITERSEQNNALTVRSNALMVGLWVEQSVYDYFDANQFDFQSAFGLGDGANSWEDWAQRQMRKWNEALASAVHPSAPQGGLDRVRLEQVVVVPDGTLPLAGGLPTNHPDTTDQTVDMMWGIPAPVDTSFYDLNDPTGAFFVEPSLIHEMNHARYLVDTYGLNVHAKHVGVRDDTGTPLFATLDPDALVRPASAGGCIMSDNNWCYSEWEIGWLNAYATQRALPGWANFNSHLGVSQHMELVAAYPSDNVLQILDVNGQPLVGAEVLVYQAGPWTGEPHFYSKYIDDVPDRIEVTDAVGQVSLGANPFSPPINIGGDDYYYGIDLIRVRAFGQEDHDWLDVAQMHVAYFRNGTAPAIYEIPTAIDPGQAFTLTPQPLLLTGGVGTSLSGTVTLTNTTAALSLDYTVTTLPEVDSVTPTSGRVSPGTAEVIEVALTCPPTDGLETFSIPVVVETLATEIVVERECQLFDVRDAVIDLEAKVDEPWTTGFAIDNLSSGVLGWSASTVSPDILVAPASGSLPVGASATVVLSGTCTSTGSVGHLVPVTGSVSGGAPVTREVTLLLRCTDDGAPSWGDPHLKTYDGVPFDFQAEGEFVLTRGDAAFEIQTRQKRLGAPYGSVAVNTAAAARVGDHRVAFYLDPPAGGGRLMVDGAALDLEASEIHALSGGGTVERLDSFRYVVRWPQGGARLDLRVSTRFGQPFALNLFVRPPAGAPLVGLFGSFDGDPLNDFALRDGTLLAGTPPSYAALHDCSAGTRCFAYDDPGGWAIRDAAESLFDYEPGVGPLDWLPDSGEPTPPPIDLSAFDPELVAWARSECLDAGIEATKVALLDACILDIVVSGDAAFGRETIDYDAGTGTAGGDPEVCDGSDNDLDGLTDEGDVCACVSGTAGGQGYRFCGTPVVWAAARAACLALGLDLAAIESDPENQAVNAWIVANAPQDRWIGLTDQAQEGVWTWADGTPFAYENWGILQPSGGTTENCVEHVAGDASWNDLSCGTLRGFLCE